MYIHFTKNQQEFYKSTVRPVENNATALIRYLENLFDLLFLKVHKTNAKAWFLQVWRMTCKNLVIVHVSR